MIFVKNTLSYFWLILVVIVYFITLRIHAHVNARTKAVKYNLNVMLKLMTSRILFIFSWPRNLYILQF